MYNILENCNVPYEQIVQCAKNNNANEVFFTVIPILIEESKKEGVNHLVSIAQAALETGWCNFRAGAVLDASYHNTCGLKTPNGGDCNDPEAHTRFANWQEGCRAHVEHLALYAGKEGYPLANPIDPRHFGFRFGAAKTVEGLTGTWAMDSLYAEKLTTIIERILSTEIIDETPPLSAENETLKNIIREMEEEIEEKNKIISEVMDENDVLLKKISQIRVVVK